MDNKDRPAVPTTIHTDPKVVTQALMSGVPIQSTTQYSGLTKREHFAGLAMQGMFANDRVIKAQTGDDIVAAAINAADALLAALEKS